MAKKKARGLRQRPTKAESQATVEMPPAAAKGPWTRFPNVMQGKMPLGHLVDFAGGRATREGLTKVKALAASSMQLLERELVYLGWMRQQTEAHLGLVRALDRSIDKIILDIEQKATVSTTKISSEGAHDAGSNQGS